MKDDFYVYVGTYTETILFGTGEVYEGKGEGIYVFRMNPDSGNLRPHYLIDGVRNPSFLTFNSSENVLYAVNELKKFRNERTGTVSAIRVDSAGAEYDFINKRSTRGTDPCYVNTTEEDRYSVVANYGTGSVSVFSIEEDGALGELVEFIQHSGSGTDPERQEGPHAHSVYFDSEERYAYVPDLGLDELRVYEFLSDGGELDYLGDKSFETDPGAGPRHLALHPEGKFLYLINELDSTIVALSFDESSGLKKIQKVPATPVDFKGKNGCAEVKISPSGRYLYGSNRGHDSIVIYEIDPATGKLEYVAHESTRGRTPRHFTIDPTGRFLLVANRDSDDLIVFEIERETGELEFSGEVVKVPTPVCVELIG
ncbi:MAG: lactonase family protein [Candidatus Hadarchaeota archaeon]